MSEITKLTHESLEAVLKNFQKFQFISFKTYEKCPLLKRVNRNTGEPVPKDMVIERFVNWTNAGIGYKYEDSVNNQLKREGKVDPFLAQPRTWGHYLKGSKTIVENYGKKYLHLSSWKGTTKAKSTWFINGSLVDYSEVDGWIKNQPKSFKASNHQLESGIESERLVFDITINKITNMSFNGNNYIVKSLESISESVNNIAKKSDKIINVKKLKKEGETDLT